MKPNILQIMIKILYNYDAKERLEAKGWLVGESTLMHFV